MIRGALSLLAGAALALLLFWGLALLVAPPPAPSDEIPLVTINLMSTPESPATAPDDDSPASESSSQPEPKSEPEPETVPEPESAPAPEPQPESEPEPAPQPAPEPVSQSPAEPRTPSPLPTSGPAMASPTDSAPVESVDRSGKTDADQASRGGASEGPIDVAELLPLYRVPPDYPRRAQRRGLEGHVELVFLVAPDGRVDADSIRVVEARPGDVFERAARQAVSQWRFEANGQLRRARQRLEFQLR